MSDSFDSGATLVAAYTNPSRFSSPMCRALAISLRKTAPADLDPRSLEALARVEQRALDVDDIATARERQAPPAVRAPRNAAGTAWSALNTALGCVASIPGSAIGEEAQRTQGSLFPDGVSFVQLEAHAAWAVGNRLLSRIDAEGLAPVIVRLVHPELLENVRDAHAQLGVVTGLADGVAIAPSGRSLVEARSRFAYAVADYARAVSVGLDVGDRTAVVRFANAMSPIDTYRITRSGEDDTDVTDAPSPVDGGGGPPPPFSG